MLKCSVLLSTLAHKAGCLGGRHGLKDARACAYCASPSPTPLWTSPTHIFLQRSHTVTMFLRMRTRSVCFQNIFPRHYQEVLLATHRARSSRSHETIRQPFHCVILLHDRVESQSTCIATRPLATSTRADERFRSLRCTSTSKPISLLTTAKESLSNSYRLVHSIFYLRLPGAPLHVDLTLIHTTLSMASVVKSALCYSMLVCPTLVSVLQHKT